jgi:plasmid stabilization system protein ParE
MPERGRAIPKLSEPTLREILVAPYRIAYRIQKAPSTIEIARIWHGARAPEDFTL